jgi:predicted enzyme related to lactoylglutathione lyase
MATVFGTITFDCQDIRRTADFWAAALDYEEKLVKSDWITLQPRSGRHGPLLGFQHESDRKKQKNRLHLDIDAVGSVDDEVQRLTKLGATFEQKVVNDDGSWHVVLHDPEDNEFCVIAP